MLQTILIGATDPNIIYLLQRYAEESGFRTIRCGYEKDMLQLARQEKPVLIVMQIEPYDTAWRNSLKILKADPAAGSIPILAYSYYDEILCDHEDGIAGYLQKSVLYSDFVAALEQAGINIE